MSDEVKGRTTSKTTFGTKWVNWALVNLNFIGFLVGLILLYIANAHFVERKLRNIDRVKHEVLDYKAQYLNLKQSIESGMTESTLTKELEEQQIKPNSAKLVKLSIGKKESVKK
jgi:uncharacterized membrane-anchored protein YhcB (DUF1043 family)